MKLVNVTNSYATLVSKQLENTDARFVSVYSYGKTLVVHSTADTHIDIILINKSRDIKEFEVAEVLQELIQRQPNDPELQVLRTPGVVEMTLPVPLPKKETEDKDIETTKA